MFTKYATSVLDSIRRDLDPLFREHEVRPPHTLAAIKSAYPQLHAALSHSPEWSPTIQNYFTEAAAKEARPFRRSFELIARHRLPPNSYCSRRCDLPDHDGHLPAINFEQYVDIAERIVRHTVLYKARATRKRQPRTRVSPRFEPGFRLWPAIDLSLLRAVDFPGVRFRMLDVTMWEAKNPREKTKAVFEPDKWKPAKSSMVDVPVSGLAALLFAHYWIGLHEVLQEPDPDRELLAKCPGKHATGQSDTFRVSPRSKERLCPACSRVHRQGSRRRG